MPEYSQNQWRSVQTLEADPEDLRDASENWELTFFVFSTEDSDFSDNTAASPVIMRAR